MSPKEKALERSKEALVRLLALSDDEWRALKLHCPNAIKDLRAALSAEGSGTIAEARKPEWMPISSAPRDGPRILAVEAFKRVSMDEDGNVTREHPEDMEVVFWSEKMGAWVGYGMALVSFEPTHWMHTPSSPEDQEKAAATPTIADPDGEARS